GDRPRRASRSDLPPGRISIVLDPSARGRGLGRRVITLACAADGGPVVAEVLSDNHASRAAFEAAGFVRQPDSAPEASPAAASASSSSASSSSSPSSSSSSPPSASASAAARPLVRYLWRPRRVHVL
ncbi:MAG TPA: GNAT family N-acetyltransferase, partial [Kofleriaceae bacterium]|nr:GNAT family N-acetyltransferase [Kofleriaceae bacterium]